MPHLIAISFSPWSEKARWALDHHRVPYRFEEYVPLLGEPLLRIRLRRPTGTVTVPVLFHEGRAYTDSLEIARHAERVGSGDPILPEAVLAEIMRWNERSNAGLSAGRALAVERMAKSPEAKAEALPPFIPASIRPLASGSTGMVLAFLRAKHGAAIDAATAEATLAGVLEELRAALSGRPYLFEDFSYADVAMAVLLQGVRPVRDAFLPIGPGLREAWTNADLARRFADLVEWRDALYEKHRRG